LDISIPFNAQWLIALEKLAGIPKEERGIPAIFIGTTVMIGEKPIKEHLEETIEKYLAEGGVDYIVPIVVPVPVVTPTAQPIPPKKPIAMAYFLRAGCPECDRVTYDIKLLESKYPQLSVHYFDIEDEENKLLNEWLSERCGVPDEKRLTAPMIFVGDSYLASDEVDFHSIQILIEKYTQTGAEPFWEEWEEEREEAKKRIIERFLSFGVLTVLGAGLIDGLNPCAFATVVFLISYLAFIGRKGREILFIGAAFTSGVFSAYLAAGLGFLKLLEAIDVLTIVGRWVYLGVALFSLLLALVNFNDYLKARRGKLEEMKFKLPNVLKRRVHRVIRRGMGLHSHVLAAIGCGFVISALELVCTGQVYLPTIVFVTSMPDLRVRALFYLVLYNLFFILPLVIVFILAFHGTTSDRMARLAKKHTSSIKLLTSFLFLILSAWLVYALT
jgi:glutaredoxin